MLARAGQSTYSPSWISIASGSGLLPFLYCTRTILRPYRTQSSDRPARNGSTRSRRAAGDTEESEGLLAGWDKELTPRSGRKGNASNKRQQSQFGKDGFKISESSDVVWRTTKPRRRPSDEAPDHKNNDKSYAPFAAWKGPPTEAVNTKPPKRIHRDTLQVPFERPKAKVREDPYADLEGTTITPTEKNAFEALFGLRKSSSNEKAAPASTIPTSEKTQPENSGAQHNDSDQPTRSYRPPSEFPKPLQTLRKIVASRDQDVLFRESKRKKGTARGDHQIEQEQGLAEREIFEVKQLMRQAKTDVEVWSILHSKVLDKVLELELDGPRPPPKNKKKRNVSSKPINGVEDDMSETIEGKEHLPVLEDLHSTEDGTTQLEKKAVGVEDSLVPATQDKAIVETPAPLDEQMDDSLHPTHPQPAPKSSAEKSLRRQSQAFPEHVRNAFWVLTDRFPGSLLPLSLIPLLKSLGPSTATLGLTTDLYNKHICHHWSKYRDPLAIDATLREMEDNVYEFDSRTRGILLDVLSDMKSSHRGRSGTVAHVLSTMDSIVTGYKRLWWWYDLMREREQDRALKRAQEEEAVEMMQREEEERIRESQPLREEAISDAAEQDEQGSESLDGTPEEDVNKESERATTPL